MELLDKSFLKSVQTPIPFSCIPLLHGSSDSSGYVLSDTTLWNQGREGFRGWKEGSQKNMCAGYLGFALQ